MKKQSITKILYTILISMMGANAFAYDFAVENADGVIIYYNYINDAKELEVARVGGYPDTVVIPEEVTYMNRTRKVTSIGERAFYNSSSLISVTIPNSVISIGNHAFQECSYLISVPIPNSVTSIGEMAFYECWGLTSVNIPNSVTSMGSDAFSYCGLTSVNISNSLTSISDHAFAHCYNLKSVTIPNSVISIGNHAFSYCECLISVTIPNSVTSIGDRAFYACTSLTSVTIADVAAWCNIKFVDYESNPLIYAKHLYLNGEEIKDLIIPNNVTSIGGMAFYNCTGLTSVTIPNSVISIGANAFYGIDMPVVISLIENPFYISYSTFSNNTFKNATLYVPKGTIEKYKATENWKYFLFIEEGTGPNGDGETPETKTCAKPTISYQNGKLTFNCETEGTTCQYTITDDDIKSGSANEIQLGVTYRISVYATKDGYNNSETATATLCWIDVEPKTEGITNSVANVRALPLLIQTNGSNLTVSGADDGTPITVYSINGTEAGSAVSQNGTATISTALQSGSAAIVKVGNKSVKIMVK